MVPAAVGVLDGVAGQVGQHPVELVGTPGDEDRVVGHVEDAGLRLLRGRGVALLRHVEQDLAQVHPLRHELVQRVGHLGHREEVLDDGLHARGAPVGRGHRATVLGPERVHVEQLEVGGHREQRGAQLVPQRVDHLHAVAVELAQAVGDRALPLDLAGVGHGAAQVAADVEGGDALGRGPGRRVADAGQDEEAQALAARAERDEQDRPDADVVEEGQQPLGVGRRQAGVLGARVGEVGDVLVGPVAVGEPDHHVVDLGEARLDVGAQARRRSWRCRRPRRRPSATCPPPRSTTRRSSGRPGRPGRGTARPGRDGRSRAPRRPSAPARRAPRARAPGGRGCGPRRRTG